MRALSLIFVALLYAACGDDVFVCPGGFEREDNGCVAVLTDAGDTGTTDAGPDVPTSNCTSECTGETPICDEDEDNSMCVQCLVPADCEGVEGRPMCDMNRCVECASSTQCETAEASLCGDDGLCAECAENADCDGVVDGDGDALNVCDTSGDANVCVGCTEATADDDCGDFSCNPATQLCTETERGAVAECGACVSDAECSTADFACVPMEFRGEARDGGYCLKLVSSTCDLSSGIRSPTDMRSSLSGADPARYCAVNEMLTTCEALTDLDSDMDCVEDNDCGAIDGDEVEPGDGLCTTVNGAANKCSVPCTGANQCPGTYVCPPTNTFCGDLS